MCVGSLFLFEYSVVEVVALRPLYFINNHIRIDSFTFLSALLSKKTAAAVKKDIQCRI